LRPWIGTEIHYSDSDDGNIFLRKLRRKLPIAFDTFHPDIVLYNAGTDTLEGDPVSGLNQTADVILARDAFVWRACRERGIPICMTLSGGYQKKTAEVIAASLRGILRLGER
jgi:histone deacetylase 11